MKFKGARQLVEISDKYIKKAKAVEQIIAELGADWGRILDRYAGQTFTNGLDKTEVFTAVLTSDNSNGIIGSLNERLTDGFGHMRGSRTGFEYGADLILGWVVEDALDEALTRLEIQHRLDGADSSRDFLPSRKVKASADFVVGAEERKLELATDLTGFWRRENRYDLRDSKFQTLKSENAVLFLIDILEKRSAVIDLAKSETYEVQAIPFHFVYKKPATAILNINGHLGALEAGMRQLASV